MLILNPCNYPFHAAYVHDYEGDFKLFPEGRASPLFVVIDEGQGLSEEVFSLHHWDMLGTWNAI